MALAMFSDMHGKISDTKWGIPNTSIDIQGGEQLKGNLARLATIPSSITKEKLIEEQAKCSSEQAYAKLLQKLLNIRGKRMQTGVSVYSTLSNFQLAVQNAHKGMLSAEANYSKKTADNQLDTALIQTDGQAYVQTVSGAIAADKAKFFN